MSEELAPAIPSSYSRKMNQMVAHETQGLYWFRHVILYVRFEVALSVFVCSVIRIANCSYALECKGLDPDRGSLPLLIQSRGRVTVDPIG